MQLTLVPRYGPLRKFQKPQWCPNKQIKNTAYYYETNSRCNGPESKSLRLIWESYRLSSKFESNADLLQSDETDAYSCSKNTVTQFRLCLPSGKANYIHIYIYIMYILIGRYRTTQDNRKQAI